MAAINIRKLEAELWESADLLRQGSKLTSNQYCMPVLGLIGVVPLQNSTGLANHLAGGIVFLNGYLSAPAADPIRCR